MRKIIIEDDKLDLIISLDQANKKGGKKPPFLIGDFSSGFYEKSSGEFSSRNNYIINPSENPKFMCKFRFKYLSR